MIKHASIYESKERADGDGLRVLVMRQWPRGVRKECTDLWLKEAGPSRALLDAYNHAGLGWDEFEERYRSEMLNERPAVLEHLRGLEAEDRHDRLLVLIPEVRPAHRWQWILHNQRGGVLQRAIQSDTVNVVICRLRYQLATVSADQPAGAESSQPGAL